MSGFRALARAQGLYYLATGLWPLLHMPSFEAVTGPKTDKWLVRAVGVLVAAEGAALLVPARRGEEPLGLAAMAALSALGLAGIDAWYALTGRISPVYLADVAPELGLAAAWGAWAATREGLDAKPMLADA
jgi:hypothetical protein